MNALARFGSEPLTMSSLEIADLTGKNHAHVMRDIRNMLDGLGIGQSSFGSAYKDVQGKPRDCFSLPKDLTLTLVTGYDVKRRQCSMRLEKMAQICAILALKLTDAHVNAHTP